MRRDGGPGIVGLELSGSGQRVDEIVASWGPEGIAAARRSLRIDYLVLLTYGPLLAGLCRLAGGRLRAGRREQLASLGPVVAGAQYAAALCDVGENTALLATLNGRRGRLPAVARGMAVTKFALLGVGLAYQALGWAPHPRESS